MATISNKFGAKKGENGLLEYYCSVCDYKCCTKYKIERHNSTYKHIKATKSNILATQNVQKGASEYICKNCNKEYKDRTGLWKHKKKCKSKQDSDSDSDSESEKEKEKSDEPTDREIIMMLINDNKEFKQILLEVCKEKEEYKNMMMKVLENGTMNHSHNTTNSHNKSFNLQFFLNETCKDAMNITDFVDSIKLQLSDLERVGELGYVEGISNIIVKNLKELDVTQRPVHCTDKKRETLYIKDEDKWEKDEEKQKMHKLVKKVADKNARMIPKYKEIHPDYGKSSSKCSDQYNKIIVESFENDYDKEEKIIKKVSKEVIVEKEHDTL